MVYCAIYLITFLFTSVHSQQDQQCLQNLTENIINEKRLLDYDLLKNSATHDSNHYYTENSKERGNIYNCLHMYCDVNEVFANRTCTKQKNHSELHVSIFEGINLLGNFSINEFSLIYNARCPKNYEGILLFEEEPYIQRNGSLLCYLYDIDTSVSFDPGYYFLVEDDSNRILTIACVELFLETTALYIQGIILSTPFLLATILICAVLPELNKKILMNCILMRLFCNIIVIALNFHISFLCFLLGYIVIFCFFSSFCWLNVMCFDIWFTFSGLRGFNATKPAKIKLLLQYSVYTFGLPALYVLFVSLIKEFSDGYLQFLTNVDEEACYIRGRFPYLMYLHIPILILMVVNIMLYILTVRKIRKVKNETMLNNVDSRRHNDNVKEQTFALYIKLLVAMGIYWIIKVWMIIPWEKILHLSFNFAICLDILTEFDSVVIFVILILKKDIRNTIKTRILKLVRQFHPTSSACD